MSRLMGHLWELFAITQRIINNNIDFLIGYNIIVVVIRPITLSRLEGKDEITITIVVTVGPVWTDRNF